MYYKKRGNYEQLEKEKKYGEAINELIAEVSYNYERFTKKHGKARSIEEVYNTIACRKAYKNLSDTSKKQVFNYIKTQKEIFKRLLHDYDKGMDR